MGAHTTSDDPTKYRLNEDLEHWKLKDPIQRVRAYLTRSAGVDHDFFDHVYVEQTAEVAEQKAQFAAYAASFEGEAH